MKQNGSIENVIYVGGKKQSIYTPKKEKERAWTLFWDRIKSIEEEEEDDTNANPTRGILDQEEIMFGERPTTPISKQQEERRKTRKRTQEVRGIQGGEWAWAADEPEVKNSNAGDAFSELGPGPRWDREGYVEINDLTEEEERRHKEKKDETGNILLAEQRGREEEKTDTPRPRRVTSEGSPVATPKGKKKTEGDAQQNKKRSTRVILGTTTNPVRVGQIPDQVDIQMGEVGTDSKTKSGKNVSKYAKSARGHRGRGNDRQERRTD